ncbi:hypothetical protein [Bacillus atrophaeus]|uniref:hypothetical protein n=1 Tax=Bacillus atrophaeus TaxID=1452 RepID=UPI00228166F1|nr:hypothetical protein [Bacillus atrophaeus]MCY8992560.1 hypothetical protein [Bacillus atrophaeus]
MFDAVTLFMLGSFILPAVFFTFKERIGCRRLFLFLQLMKRNGRFYLIGVGLFTQFAFRGFEFAARNSSSLLSFK